MDWTQRDFHVHRQSLTPDEPNRSLNLVAGILVVIFAALWLAAFVDRVLMPLIARVGVQVTVPDIRRFRIETADSLCKSLGLELVRGRARPEEHLPPGIILDQYPAAGSTVKPGRMIEVVVSDPANLVSCPSVVGHSPREAVIMADSCGLIVRPERISYDFSETNPEGVVFSQTPPPFTGILHGSELRLTVSLGSAPTTMEVPNLVGRNIEDVRLLLARYRLTLGEVTNFPIRKTVPGTILNQTPAPGSPPPEGGFVSVSIAAQPIGDESAEEDSLPGLGMPPDTVRSIH